ncbi:MAG: ATP synthase F1 subunit gamma [Acidobacteria bacterium]|nr:ATP synthase F1 subunit gamma [Acidobacteriota bacterium]
MPSILDIRRRIRSVRNTQQITRAMKMVAGAKLSRAQDRAVRTRPYVRQTSSVLSSLAARVENPDHPLLERREVRQVLLVLLTADKGLCGAFNSNLIRAAQHYLEEHKDLEVSMITIGRRGSDFFRKRDVPKVAEWIGLFGRLKFTDAEEITSKIISLYTDGTFDAVDLLYNEFKTVLTQKLVVERFLPIEPIAPPHGAGEAGDSPLVDYIYEQPPGEIFGRLLPRYVEIEVYRALIESEAAELASRMTAMDAATKNAGEMIDQLTLNMNRIRQAAITREIIEIVSGAAAL